MHNENKDCNYTVYIVDDMLEYLDIDAMPNNIEVFSVDKIDREFLENLQK